MGEEKPQELLEDLLAPIPRAAVTPAVQAALGVTRRQEGVKTIRTSYAVVTPVRDERLSLQRLAHCLTAQTVMPRRWYIVDTGSSDGTLEWAGEFVRENDWVRLIRFGQFPDRDRGAPVVLALEAGFGALAADRVDVVVKVDADVTVESHYFEFLLDAFDRDSGLGMASGRRIEPTRRGWKEWRLTFGSVEAQCRAYRWECLQAILPFERGIGWDGIDEVKAALSGWRTLVLEDVRFTHHRLIGDREESRIKAWWQDGRGAWYMGYRPSYLCLRALYRAWHDPCAVALIGGFMSSWLRRAPRCADGGVRAFLRRKQRLRNLPRRVGEVTGHARQATVRRVDLLLVSDPGGHLWELVALQPVWREFSRVWVTLAGPDLEVIPATEHVVFAHAPTQRSIANLLRNAALAYKLIASMRPRVVLTTGAGLAVPFAWIGRLFGLKIIHVECSGRVGVSLSGRVIAPIADRFYVQWPDLIGAVRKARYAGSVFSQR
jgi:glycosyltransferase involved in cell wall biosynthesis